MTFSDFPCALPDKIEDLVNNLICTLTHAQTFLSSLTEHDNALLSIFILVLQPTKVEKLF